LCIDFNEDFKKTSNPLDEKAAQHSIQSIPLQCIHAAVENYLRDIDDVSWLRQTTSVQ
jgi:hypothetical protein